MLSKLHISVIVVASGKGKRMKSDIPKQYLTLYDKPILAYTLETFQKCKDIDDITLVVNKDDINYCKENILYKFNIDKVKNIVEGGAERQYSVFNGINSLDKTTDIVLIHDGVRPFIKSEDVSTFISKSMNYDCCVVGVKVKDTIKSCDENGFVKLTPKRDYLWVAQTPQIFKYKVILNIYNKAMKDNILGTDDSMLAESFGYKVKMIEGNYNNIKITTPEDLQLGKVILSQ